MLLGITPPAFSVCWFRHGCWSCPVGQAGFVSLLLALAQQYRVRVTLTRDSADHAVEAAFRSVVKKVHPDKGGAVGDAQRLQHAREEWKAAKAKGPRPGRRPVKAAVLTAGKGSRSPANLSGFDQCCAADVPWYRTWSLESLSCLCALSPDKGWKMVRFHGEMHFW